MYPVLCFVIPCFNEESVLPLTVPVFLEKLSVLAEKERISPESYILFVNDASRDGTWKTICKLHEEDARVTGISLARNVGEQKALLAGLFTAMDRADCVITMDCDLQDDINAVDEMVEQYLAGNDLVLGVRSSRKQADLKEKFFAGGFYLLMGLLKTGLVKEHANYRLMSKRAIACLKEQISLPFYLPAMASTMGLPTATVTHERLSRVAGKTGYTVKRRFRLAFDALYAHSSLPLTLITLCAAVSAVLTLVCIGFLIALSVRDGAFRTDLCILASVWAALSVLLAVLRLLGEYIRMIFINSKREPIYQIKETVE